MLSAAEEQKRQDHDASCTGTFQPPVLPDSRLWICDECSFAIEEAPPVPAVRLRTLADFKRFLAEPGATVQVIRNDWTDANKTSHPLTPKPEYWEAKQVARLQSNSVQFTTGSWLAFPKAAHVRFQDDTAILDMNQDGQFTQLLIYRLSRTATR